MPETVDRLLGVRWHTDTLTYKKFPGSAYLHAAFDCAERLHRRLGRLDAERVGRIVVAGSLLTWQMERKVAGAAARARHLGVGRHPCPSGTGWRPCC
ncbi:MmgE/PrpD family protein [Streptomyces tricolor]|nr:MmgE/PrpD family protein [Streptomyces tricolor]